MPTLRSLQSKLAKLQRQEAKLQKQIEAEHAQKYRVLPAQFGLPSVDALIHKLLPLASPRLKHRLKAVTGGKPTAAVVPVSAPAKAKRVRRTYSKAKRKAVRAALAEGKLTIGQIAKEHKVVVSTLHVWKKQWGLVKPRTPVAAKKAAKKPAPKAAPAKPAQK